MSQFKSFRGESRNNYGREVEDGQGVRNDELKLGALLRIADATELMAKRYDEMQRSLDYYKRLADERESQVTHLKHQLRAARGNVTRLRNRMSHLPKDSADEQ